MDKAAHTTDGQQAPRPKRPAQSGRLRRAVHYVLLVLLLTLAGALAGLSYVLRSEGGQSWLRENINATLKSSLQGSGLHLRLTHLSGPLPFGCTLGLEAADAQGLWLTAPENSFVWDWRALPGAVRIAEVRSVAPVLTRLPDLPAEPEVAASQPLTVDGLRTLLGEMLRTLGDLPGWLPALQLDSLRVENALLPPDLLGGLAATSAGQGMRLNLDAGLTAHAQGADARVRLDLAAAQAASFTLSILDCAKVEIFLEAHATPPGVAHTGLAVSSRLEAQVLQPVLQMDALPPDLLGQEARLILALEGTVAAQSASASSAVAPVSAGLALTELKLTAGRLSANGQGQWKSQNADAPDKAAVWLDGPLDLHLAVTVDNAMAAAAESADKAPEKAAGETALDMLRAPLTLTFSAKGGLLQPQVEARLACADVQGGGHALKDAALSLSSASLGWGRVLGLTGQPDGSGGSGTDGKDVLVLLDVRGHLDQRPVSLATQIFYGQGQQDTPVTDRAGLRALRLDAAGLEGTGDITALLTPGKMPALTGAVHLRVADWRALSAFVPGQNLNGQAALDVELRADGRPDGQAGNAAQGATAGQQALVRWKIPHFSLAPAQGEGEPLTVRGLDGHVRLTDLFGQAALTAQLDLGNADLGAVALGAQLRAQGPLQGPVDLSLKTTGGVAGQLALQWRPGQIALKTLDMRLREVRGQGGGPLGLRATRAATVGYGEGGLSVAGLDLTLSPSGRVRAEGALSPEKFDLRFNLDALTLEPWRALLPVLPLGTVEARARLGGSPSRPQGDFRLAVRDLRVPGSPLKALNLALVGSIEHTAAGSALLARLEMPPEAVRALGGSEARLQVRLPLLFGPDGLPRPAPQGRLAGQVRWLGATGPVWSLLPLADRRLTGSLDLNLDLKGTLDAPRVTGALRVDKARYEDLLLGILLTDINLRLELDEKKGAAPAGMRLKLSAADGLGGSLQLAGKGGLDGRNLSLRAELDHLRPLRRRDLRINLSGQAQVTGSATAPNVTGEIIINQGALLLNNLAVGGSITTLPITEGTTPVSTASDPAKAAGASAPVTAAPAESGQGSLQLRIRAPGRFVVEGHGLTSEWQADMLVSGRPDAPVVTGNLQAIKGYFDFLTKKFTLTRGLITFGGGSLSNPLLDVVLTNEVPDLTARISISGTVSKMKLSLSSEPALPRDEVLSRVLFGRSVNELGRLEALQLAGAVAQLAGFGSSGGGVLDFARKALGVDVLRLGSAPAGARGEAGDQASGSTLEMGKYINDQIYVGVEQGMKPNSTAFIIQMEMTPRLNLELRTEQEETWGGVRWKYNY